MWTIYGLWCEGCFVDRVRKSIVLVLVLRLVKIHMMWAILSTDSQNPAKSYVGVLFASTLLTIVSW